MAFPFSEYLNLGKAGVLERSFGAGFSATSEN
jgi:hypothetical protein